MTDRMKRVLEAVRQMTAEQQRPPLMTEIAARLQEGPSTVSYCVRRLRQAGFVERAQRYERGVRLADRCVVCGRV